MEQYVFVKKINGTDETGIVDISKTPPELICLCSEHQSNRLLQALNISTQDVTAISATAAKNHCTIVCGWEESGKLTYMRTFDYQNDKAEKELAQVAVKWCQDNCKGGWLLSDISCINITELN